MASYQTTGSYLRNSVFDAALEIGLGDPNLANWLEDLPEVAEEKANGQLGTVFGPFLIGTNTLTTITSNSSQGSFHYTTPSRHPNPSPRITTPRAVLPEKLELKGNAATSENTLHSSPFILPLQPSKRAPTKLLKKGRGDKKEKGSSREKDQDNNSNAEVVAPPAPAVPTPYSFLQHEPTPPPSDHEKGSESKGFFGRLRDRSRSKSRAARKASRPSEDSAKDGDLLAAAATAAADWQRRGREPERKDVVQQRPGGVTVVKVNEGGLPQLQLDPLSNRKSADLLSALSAEFSLVAATAAESSEKEKEAIAAYYAGVMNPPKPVEQQQPPTAEPEEEAVPHSQPIPRLKSSVMDRPHPKVRTSGFWANKDRGVMVPGAANRRVARKASASRRASVRAAAVGGAVRRAPSHKRKSSALGGGGKMAAGSRASRRLSINGLIDAIREEGVAGTETTTTDFEEVDTDSDDDDADRPTSLAYSAQPPAKKKGSSDSEPVPAIPVIIERRPSTKSTRSSKPALSLTLNNLAPVVPGSGTTPIGRLSPGSPMRSPGSRFRRSSHGSGLPPSPLKPPPTSPLPPTPNDGGSQVLSVVEDHRPQSGVVTPTAAKAVLATMPSPRQSDWFEDEDSDVDVGRRTPFSRTPGTSRPASPSEEWIVPTPTSVVTTFQPAPPPSDFNKPIPRPILTGRAPATAEARARATASAAMSRTASTLVVPGGAPNGIPATPRRPGTSPQRTTPGHLRVRPGEPLRGTTPPPPSTWNPPTSALTRISSLRSQKALEPEGPKQQQQPPQPQQQQARSHSRDDSNESNASGSQRGRMSPFPVRPGGSRDVSPLPSLKRTPSKMSIRQKTERVRSHHAELGGDFDVEAFGRQSGESVRSGESEGWATASSTRSSNEGARSARPGNYNGVPREAYMPSPSPMTARRPGMHSRGPSPLPPLSATLPLNPSPHRPGSRMATTPNPAVGRPPHPILRPSASFTISRPQQFSASNLAPSSSLRIDRNSRASMRSAYSASGDLSDDDDARSFRGLDLDDEEEDRRSVAGGGFGVIAARLGDPSSKSAKLLQRLAVEDAEEDVQQLPPKGRGSGVNRPPAPSLLKVPQRSMTGPNSPNLSPRMRNVPTPTSAGGARWI
ncbi:hypothetical protein FRC04_001655 [Tulasnella sp. 424]|nr:hypothetical protein FRC04_001655 [Tulasnella sp. 424]KAG8971103.1 hypothetical protein FRC05_011472 [Tulasnella sp. 425]